jgi:hypothetical protein
MPAPYREPWALITEKFKSSQVKVALLTVKSSQGNFSVISAHGSLYGAGMVRGAAFISTVGPI